MSYQERDSFIRDVNQMISFAERHKPKLQMLEEMLKQRFNGNVDDFFLLELDQFVKKLAGSGGERISLNNALEVIGALYHKAIMEALKK